jgi:ABC-type sugar transport system permease subunit
MVRLTPYRKAMKRIFNRRRSELAWCYLFIFPFVLFFGSFTIWPVVGTMIFSVFRINAIGQIDHFVGLENYVRVFTDPTFLLSCVNTIFFTLVNTLIKLPLALFLAILLTRRWLKGKTLIRTGFFLPLVIPSAIIGMIFTFLLNPANGALNSILVQLNLVNRPIDFLGSRWLGMLTIILISVWGVLGQYVIYWMAAIQSVPEETFEAAEIDGANEWQKLVHITLPIIRPVATIIFFLALVNGLQVFDLVLTLTGGGPGSQTYVVAYYIYTRGFTVSPPNYGVASAASVLFGVATLLAISIQGFFVTRAQKTIHEYGS